MKVFWLVGAVLFSGAIVAQDDCEVLSLQELAASNLVFQDSVGVLNDSLDVLSNPEYVSQVIIQNNSQTCGPYAGVPNYNSYTNSSPGCHIMICRGWDANNPIGQIKLSEEDYESGDVMTVFYSGNSSYAHPFSFFTEVNGQWISCGGIGGHSGSVRTLQFDGSRWFTVQ